VTTATLPPVAGFWRRTIAFIIDGIVLSLISAGVYYVFPNFWSGHYYLGVLAGFLIWMLYFSLTESSVLGGQSLGKVVMGIWIVDQYGQALSDTKVIARTLLIGIPLSLNQVVLPPYLSDSVVVSSILSVVIVGFLLANVYLMIFNHTNRRCLHDEWTGTYVVRKEFGEKVAERTPKFHQYVSLAILLVPGIAIPFDSTDTDAIVPGYSAFSEQAVQLDSVTFVSVHNSQVVVFGNDSMPVNSVSIVITPGDLNCESDELACRDTLLQVTQYAVNYLPDVCATDKVYVSIQTQSGLGFFSIADTPMDAQFSPADIGCQLSGDQK